MRSDESLLRDMETPLASAATSRLSTQHSVLSTSPSTAFRRALTDVGVWSRYVLRRPLRPYQIEPARAIVRSITERTGLTFTVEMSRQAGKNELSAHLESFLLTRFQNRAATMVKAAPTFKPQTINSILRLTTLLENPLTAGHWLTEFGYIVRVGQARILFFSAGPEANVVGATASLAIEIDEAQDVDPAKHDKDFAPMAASTNATRIFYGTAWDDNTLLQRQIEVNLAAERRDGRRRHFAYPWHVVAEYNPAYGAYAQAERDRLGADHPLFKTQYALETIQAEGAFIPPRLQAQLWGAHPAHDAAWSDTGYVAGLDLAGSVEVPAEAALSATHRDADSTALVVARIGEAASTDEAAPLFVEAAYLWQGPNVHRQGPVLLDLLRNVWPVTQVVVDATGAGAGVAGHLLAALGESVVTPFVYTQQSKSQLAYHLLAAIQTGRLKWYAHGLEETASAELHRELEQCRYTVRPNQTLSFAVPDGRGHDDLINALALAAWAGPLAGAPAAATVVPASPSHGDAGPGRRRNQEL